MAVSYTHLVPSLSIILVGSNPASEIYVRNKIKAANYCGINANLIRKDEDIQEEELVNLVNQLNEDQSCHGIIVQLPLPKHINEQKVIDAISYKKDVDGFGIINKGRLFSGLDSIESATPHGIIQLLDAYDIEPVSYTHLIPEEDVIITITNRGYIKRMTVDTLSLIHISSIGFTSSITGVFTSSTFSSSAIMSKGFLLLIGCCVMLVPPSYIAIISNAKTIFNYYALFI